MHCHEFWHVFKSSRDISRFFCELSTAVHKNAPLVVLQVTLADVERFNGWDSPHCQRLAWEVIMAADCAGCAHLCVVLISNHPGSVCLVRQTDPGWLEISTTETECECIQLTTITIIIIIIIISSRQWSVETSPWTVDSTAVYSGETWVDSAGRWTETAGVSLEYCNVGRQYCWHSVLSVRLSFCHWMTSQHVAVTSSVSVLSAVSCMLVFLHNNNNNNNFWTPSGLYLPRVKKLIITVWTVMQHWILWDASLFLCIFLLK